MPTTTAQERRDAARERYLAYVASCPSRKVLDLVSDKWVTLTMFALTEGPQRYSEISRTMAGVSQKMLTQTLRTLERDGLVTRTVTFTVPIRVDYALTPLGSSLLDTLEHLRLWSEEHVHAIEQAQATYDDQAALTAG